MKLYPSDVNSGLYPKVEAGTIHELAQTYHNELTLKGYSLLLEDVELVFMESVKFYASHATLQAQLTATSAITIDGGFILDGSEFAIIEQLVRAHCDVIQADLMEGSGSLGADHFGLSKSEAEQNYKQERGLLPKNAFVQAPFSFKTAEGN